MAKRPLMAESPREAIQPSLPETIDCPLNDEDCKNLDKVIESGEGTGKLLLACRECGLPVDDAMARNAEQVDVARRLKAKFFPNRK